MTRKQKLFINLAKSGSYKVPARTPEEEVLKNNLADEVFFNPIRFGCILWMQVFIILVVLLIIKIFFF